MAVFNPTSFEPSCIHKVRIPRFAKRDATEIIKWLEDPLRAGYWYWGTSDDFERYWMLCVSDADVAFESKMRWG